jgi:hypothetical protein
VCVLILRIGFFDNKRNLANHGEPVAVKSQSPSAAMEDGATDGMDLTSPKMTKNSCAAVYS